jgi:hypothetical protein
MHMQEKIESEGGEDERPTSYSTTEFVSLSLLLFGKSCAPIGAPSSTTADNVKKKKMKRQHTYGKR